MKSIFNTIDNALSDIFYKHKDSLIRRCNICGQYYGLDEIVLDYDHDMWVCRRCKEGMEGKP